MSSDSQWNPRKGEIYKQAMEDPLHLHVADSLLCQSIRLHTFSSVLYKWRYRYIGPGDKSGRSLGSLTRLGNTFLWIGKKNLSTKVSNGVKRNRIAAPSKQGAIKSSKFVVK